MKGYIFISDPVECLVFLYKLLKRGFVLIALL